MTRQTYETGAERDKLDDVRYDLISPFGLCRLAETYAEGAKKYSDHNWRNGFPVSSLINHVLNHIVTYLAGAESEEDHLAHAAWGLFALMEQEATHPELDDRWDFDHPNPEPLTVEEAETVLVVFTRSQHDELHENHLLAHYHLLPEDPHLDDLVMDSDGHLKLFEKWSCSPD